MRGKYVSKWIVLGIDFMLISFSLLIAFAIQNRLNLYDFRLIDYYKGLVTVFVFCLIGYFIFKPHEGIIRHTSIHDIKVIFYARSIGFVLNLAFVLFFESRLGLNSFALPGNVLVISYFLSLYMLIQFRLGVKYIFKQGKRVKSKPRILIYGSGESGRITFDALYKNHEIVGFIDDNTSLSGKSLLGKRIYGSNEDIEHIIDRYQIQEIVFSIQNINAVKKREIIDRCLTYNVNLKVVPPINSWLNGQLTNSQIKNVKIEELLGRDVIALNKELLNTEIVKKSILITGGAGSIGSELVRQIIKYEPKQLVVLDQAETPLHLLEIELSNNSSVEINYVLADIRDEQKMKTIFDRYQIDWIFHAAAYKHVPAMELHPSEAIKTNCLGTKLIADLADKYQIEKMVFVSTDKAVNPTNVMGASKRLAEMYVQSKNKQSKTNFITTRFGNVLGSNGSVIPLFKKQIESGGPITVTHPKITRYFMTIPEACSLVLDACVMGKGGEIYVFDMGESVLIKDLAEKMIKLSGLTINKDISIIYTGLRPGEKLFEELLTEKESILPTHHDKIMIAKVFAEDYNVLNPYLVRLHNMIDQGADNMDIVQTLKEIVKEYKSKNSPYELLDIDAFELLGVKK
ncbi:MAG: nucleoside-diphosphate sugar epimerase/dehydratase [Chitinophagaceae bacterium]